MYTERHIRNSGCREPRFLSFSGYYLEELKRDAALSTVKKIADYFSVPVDYFYDTDIDVTVHDNHGVIGDTHAPVTIHNGSVLGEIEQELLSICGKLDTKRKAALLLKATELLEEQKND